MKIICFKIAFREIKSCLKFFKSLIFCLILGITAITTVGSVRDSIFNGMSIQSKEIAGGDVSIKLTYRFANFEELKFIKENSLRFSEVTDFRSMISYSKNGDTKTSLIQIKGIDYKYPLFGNLMIEDQEFSFDILKEVNGVGGILIAPILFEKLDLQYGSKVQIGSQFFAVRGTIITEPDAASSSFQLGPRVIASNGSLKKAGLLSTGTMFDTQYKLKIKEGIDLNALKETTLKKFNKSGIRWSDHTNSVSGLKEFIERISSFLILIGISGLTLGGIGIASGINNYIEKNKFTIASLKSIGATKKIIFSVYVLVILTIALIGTVPGIILGILTPFLITDILSNYLLLPITPKVFIRPIIEALSFGLIISMIFSLFPLEKQISSSVKDLFRSEISDLNKNISVKSFFLPSIFMILLTLIIFVFSENSFFVFLSIITIFLITIFLILCSNFTKIICKLLYNYNFFKKNASFKIALSNLNNPKNEIRTPTIILGLCLTIISSINLIDVNLRNTMNDDIPEKAPSFFFVDIQKDQIEEFYSNIKKFDDKNSYETTPMLRGILSKINGIEATEYSGEHWVLKGDRGITFKETLLKEDKILFGKNWDKNYDGFPLVSFSKNEADELNLKINDIITLNILGKEIDAKIINFREVDFSDMGINFLMILNKNSIGNAPHSYLSTVSTEKNSESSLLKIFTKKFPNITIIPVKEIIDKFASGLNSLIITSLYASLITIIIGLLVLIGTSATNERKYLKEMTIMKTIGCTREVLIKSYLIKTLILSFFTSIFSICLTTSIGFIFVNYILDISFSINWYSTFLIILIGVLINILSGIYFNIKSSSKKISSSLRNNN